MKRIAIIFVALLLGSLAINAQEIVESTNEVEHTGTEALVDSTLVGRDIFSILPEGLHVSQPAKLRQALASQVEANGRKKYNGFRIRLYVGSAAGAREASASAIRRFESAYPGVQADRTYDSPNFKVTAGYFRTRTEAEALLNKIKSDFPNAFVVRESFKFPSIGTPRSASEIVPEQ